MPTIDDAQVRRYLLGQLPDAEAEALEDRYFADPELLDRIRGIEDDLLDDYAAGRLPAAVRAPLEARYLAAPRLRERIAVARALQLATSRRPGRLARAGDRSMRQWPRWVAVAAGLLIGVAVWSRWPGRPDRVTTASPAARATSPVETPRAATSTTPIPSGTPRAEQPTARIVLALAPVRLRGEGGPPELREPRTMDTIVLALQGIPGTRPASPVAGLEAVITTVEGERVWAGAARGRSPGDRPDLLASVELAADSLPPADYVVTLAARGQTLHRYFFRVTPRT